MSRQGLAVARLRALVSRSGSPDNLTQLLLRGCVRRAFETRKTERKRPLPMVDQPILKVKVRKVHHP